MRLTDALPAWGGMLFGAGVGFAGDAPKIGPELVAYYSPSRHRHQPGALPSWESEFWGRQARLFGPWPQAMPVALAEGPNSDTSREPSAAYGSLGLQSFARRQVRAGAALLEQHRSSCAFWTVSVPDQALAGLAEPMAWARFQSNLRHRLVRLLKRRMGQALVLGVVEVHPKRSERMGYAIPHLHILYRGKRPGERRWRIRTHELDRMIGQALEAAGVVGVDCSRSGRVVAVKKSVAAYLSSYMTKKAAPVFERGRGEFPVIRVCQWWLMSRAMKQWIEDCTVPVDPNFLAFAIDRIRKGVAGFQAFVSRVPIADPCCPPCWRVSFVGVDSLREALRRWLTLTGSMTSAANTLLNDRSLPGINPEQHKLLRKTCLLGLPVSTEHQQRRDNHSGSGGGNGPDCAGPSGEDGGWEGSGDLGLLFAPRLRGLERQRRENVDGGARSEQRHTGGRLPLKLTCRISPAGRVVSSARSATPRANSGSSGA